MTESRRPPNNHDERATSLATARVIKKLAPGQDGTKRLLEQYGSALVCVRYRHDRVHDLRYTTVELVVDEKRPHHPASGRWVVVPIHDHERELRSLVKSAGAQWDGDRHGWRMPYSLAQRLGLESRAEEA